MDITAEEESMYKVMRSIYDSGIPISFKGSMVLKACLLEAGYPEDTRHTVDIDANWDSDTPPSKEQMIGSLQDALRKSGIDLDIHLYRMYGEGRSAGFELSDRSTGEILFSMDVDVDRPVPPTRLYQIAGSRFRGVSPAQMIADKVSAISTDKVFQRVKDVIDLYYLSHVFPFDKADILQTLKNGDRTLGTFYGFLHRTEEIEHAYEKFRFSGDVDKPPFEEVYHIVKSYIRDVLPKDKNKDLDR